MQVNATATIRQYMHGVNLQAARLFCEKSQEVQAQGAQLTHKQRPHHELKAFVSAAVLHSVGFLEALINEFLLDIVESKRLQDGAVDESIAARIGVLWKEVLRGSSSILPKYQLALSAFDVAPFDTGKQPFQAAKTLVTLRNTLVHHVPESTEVILGEVNQESSQKLVQLLSPYVETNPWHDGATTGSINRALWAGTADWAKATAVALADEFYIRISRERPYEFIINEWGSGYGANAG